MFLRALQIALPFIWFGAVGAISFMEAPLKFTAPNVTIPLGVEIGQIIFHMLNRIEIVLCVLLAVALGFALPKSKLALAAYGLVAAILLVQTFWLFPLLDERSRAVISGMGAPFSRPHIVYIVADSVKVLTLLVLGFTLATVNMSEGARERV